MKNLVKITMMIAGLAMLNLSAYAGGCTGCVADTSGSCTGPLGAVCPDPAPPANAGVYYDEDITFYVIPEIDTSLPVVGNVTIAVSEARLVDITGLPQGLSWSCNNSPNCAYHPVNNSMASQYGCVKICGVPCGAADTMTVTFEFEYDADIPFVGTQTVPNSIDISFILNSSVTNLDITSASDYLCPSGAGSSLTLTASPGYAAYQWSTGDTVDAITVAAAGPYAVTGTDSNGCTQEVAKTISNLEADAGTDQTICANQITSLSASGGETFSWAPTANLTDAASSNPVVFELATTTDFVLTVSNASCSDMDTVKVIIDTTNNCAGACPGECTVDDAGCSGSSPTVCQNSLPALTAGTAYQESFTFYFPATVQSSDVIQYVDIPSVNIPGLGNLQDLVGLLPNTSLDVDTVVVSVDGLPQGMAWECDQIGNNCTYYPGLYPSVTQYGCISLCGDDICDAPGNYDVTVTGNFGVTLPLPDIVFSIPGVPRVFDVSYPMTVTLPVSSVNGTLQVTSSNGTNMIHTGETVTLSAVSGFASYNWSTGASTTTIDVTAAGTYTVTVTDDNGCEQVESFELTQSTSINDIEALRALTVYPNPSTGRFEVAFNLKENASTLVEVYTVAGKRILKRSFEGTPGNNELSINLEDKASGVFFLKVISEKGAAVKRISVY